MRVQIETEHLEALKKFAEAFVNLHSEDEEDLRVQDAIVAADLVIQGVNPESYRE